MDEKPPSSATAAEGSRGEGEVIDSGVLLTRLRMQRLSRDAIVEELVEQGLSLDEAVDVVDADVSMRLTRLDGKLSLPSRPPSPPPAYSALGGWLLLPAIGLATAPFVLLRDLRSAYEVLRTLDGAELPHVGLRDLLVTAVALNAALLALSVITIWFFFRRKRAAPRLYIALLVALLVATVIDVYAASTLVALAGADVGRLVGRVAATGIWTAYFLTSQRVRETFVR